MTAPRPYTAPLLSEGPDTENAPDLTGRGRSVLLEHETGLASGLRPLCASRAKLGREPATPHVGKEMLGLISLRFFAQSGHIDAFRSIVGEARLGRDFAPQGATTCEISPLADGRARYHRKNPLPTGQL